MSSFLKIITNILSFRLDNAFYKMTGQTQVAFSWNENGLFRLELKRDILVRVLIILAAWALGTGIMGILFSLSTNSDNDSAGFGLALGLGLVIAGPVVLFLFVREPHVARKIRMREDRIERNRTYVSMGMWGQWIVEETWPYEAIRACRIIPGKTLGKRFSLMTLEGYESTLDITCIPKRIDLRELVAFLQSKGVNVEQGAIVPAKDKKGISWIAPLVAGVVAFPFLFAGLSMLGEKQARIEQEVVEEENPFKKYGIEGVPSPSARLKEMRANAPGNRSRTGSNNSDQEENTQPNATIRSGPRRVPSSRPTFTRPSTGGGDPALRKYTPPTYRPPGPPR